MIIGSPYSKDTLGVSVYKADVNFGEYDLGPVRLILVYWSGVKAFVGSVMSFWAGSLTSTQQKLNESLLGSKGSSTSPGLYGGFPKLGVPFWGPYIKDNSILGSILGSLILGNYHIGNMHPGSRLESLGQVLSVACCGSM